MNWPAILIVGGLVLATHFFFSLRRWNRKRSAIIDLVHAQLSAYGPMSAADIRESLAASGYVVNLVSFFDIMATMEDSGLITTFDVFRTEGSRVVSTTKYKIATPIDRLPIDC